MKAACVPPARSPIRVQLPPTRGPDPVARAIAAQGSLSRRARVLERFREDGVLPSRDPQG